MSGEAQTERGPDGRGYRLPPEAYTSQEWLDRELHTIFEHTWALVADAAAVAAPGDYVAVQVGLTPLLIVRGHDGVLRSFVNMCRHRGMALLDGCGSVVGALRCPYHGWRYGHDGALEAIPQRGTQFDGVDPDALGLLPASVGEWGGMVFAHPDADAPPLADALGELPAHMGSFRSEDLAQVAAVDFEAAFNWKLFVENHIDVYHLWYLHEDSLGAYDHANFEYWQLGRNWASYEALRRTVIEGGSGDHLVGTRQIVDLDDRDRQGIGAHMLFPNILFATTAEFFASYAVTPLAPDRSRIQLRIRAHPDADGDLLAKGVRAFIDEDVAACEQIQVVLGSERFVVGPLARTHEAPILAFQDALLDELGPLPEPAMAVSAVSIGTSTSHATDPDATDPDATAPHATAPHTEEAHR